MDSSIIASVKHGAAWAVGFFGVLFFLSTAFAAATWWALPNATTNTALSSAAWNDIVSHVNQLATAINVSGTNVGIGAPAWDALGVTRTASVGPVASFVWENHSSGDNATRVRIQDVTWGVAWFLSAANDGKFSIHQGAIGDRITVNNANGNVGIGTSATSTSKLEVNGDVKATNIAKAWVSFNGTNLSINDSYGVASVTRNGTGWYKITWAVPFSNTKYVVLGACNAWGYSGDSFTLEGNAISGHTYQGIFTNYANVGCRIPSTNANADSDLVTVVAYGK